MTALGIRALRQRVLRVIADIGVIQVDPRRESDRRAAGDSARRKRVYRLSLVRASVMMRAARNRRVVFSLNRAAMM